MGIGTTFELEREKKENSFCCCFALYLQCFEGKLATWLGTMHMFFSLNFPISLVITYKHSYFTDQ